MRNLLVCMALLGSACGTLHRYDYSGEPDPRKSEYVIGVADALSIQVWKNPELSKDVTVRPDGTITLPLIGDLKADGRTPSQLRDEVTRQLTKFVRGEGVVVTIAVTGVNSYRFTISGNVAQAGVFSSNRYLTVLEAIQLAGGPSRFASPRKMRLYRQGRDGVTRVIPLDYEALLSGAQPEANLPLLAGDHIYVP